MGREVLALTLDRLADLPDPCVQCSFWEGAGGPLPRASDGGAKEGWLASTLLEWGAPGRVAYVDGQPVGYLAYAPAHLVPRAMAFPTSPVSPDAVVLATARVDPAYAGQGLGRVLVQAAAKDCLRRGVRAMEAFGRRDLPGASLAAGGPGTAQHCVLPEAFLSAVGFGTARDHPTLPRMRLDLRSVARWREEVEQAVERLLAPVLRPAGLGSTPLGTAHREGSRHHA